jgi:iron complex outermembrane receptor protein
MMRVYITIILILLLADLTAQPVSKIIATDTSSSEVTVTAFQSNQQWKSVPAAVTVLNATQLGQYGNGSMVPVMNTVTGVRMEERSPASYRLSLRGSLLRSPFGVRNVKVYWNEIPLTDAAGNSYINLVNLEQLTSIEVIKGPVASMYGAGTGGAVLMHSRLPFADKPIQHFEVGLTGGSFGMFNESTGWHYSGKALQTSIEQSHQQSDGYREQSASRKDIIKWQGARQWHSQQLEWLVFYTDLYYQTPGGITQAQMDINPKLSRQPGGGLPGSIQQKAAIYNKTLFGALHHTASLGKLFMLKTFYTANQTHFDNPFITNFETRIEKNMGAGTQLVFQTNNAHIRFQWINGMEWLYNQATITDYGNRAGVKDTVQFTDNSFANQWFGFSQAQVNINNRWNLTAGFSINNQTYRYKRLTDPSTNYVSKQITAVFTPRIAILYRLSNSVSWYALAAKGFSAPALAEIRPSDGNYYGNLNAEYGWNYETGFKGSLDNERLEFDVAAYNFSLQNAIVRRTNAIGQEYFVNAGSTVQNGMEGMLKFHLISNKKQWISHCELFSSYSFQPYRFETYQQTTNNYNGNALTGVPKNTWVSGMNIENKNGFYWRFSINCTSSIPLTDANDAFANAYQLVQSGIGFHNNEKTINIQLGIDNLLNQNYSLGNDINAAGKRYFNPAPSRNFFLTFKYAIKH